MSYAEQTAYQLYEAMHLDKMDDEVKKCLMSLLTQPQGDNGKYNDLPLPEFNSYKEAVALGAKDIDVFGSDLHKYIDQLAIKYNIQ